MRGRSAVVVSARRTPFGRRGGQLGSTHPHDLLAVVQDAALADARLEGAEVDVVIGGCVTQAGEQSYNVARLASLAGGLPVEVAGITVDAQCGSSQQAANLAASMVCSGAAQIVLVTGVESMSRVPLGHARAAGPGDPLGERYRARFGEVTAGESAELIADRWGIDRAACDAYALESQARAGAARDQGRFEREIVPVPTAGGEVRHDEGIRDSTAEGLAGLPATFREHGVHTAASSSQLSDGAGALVVMDEALAVRRGLTPLARIVDHCIVGVDPVIRLTGPIPATRLLLDRAGLSASDVDLYEVNEAFASVVLAWLREIGADPGTVNPAGGAIALGHPVGATGARLLTSAAHAVACGEADRAVVTMCCGTGLGTGTLLEAVR